MNEFVILSQQARDIILAEAHLRILMQTQTMPGGNMSIKKIPFPFYQIKKGENLKIISEKYKIDSTKILLDNSMSPKQIREGVFIVLKN